MNPSEMRIPVVTPPDHDHDVFTDAAAAVERLKQLYAEACTFLAQQFSDTVTGAKPATRYRAFYPEIRMTSTSHAQIDTRLSFGHVSGPGTYSTTITRPDLFENYLVQQIDLLLENHGVPVLIGPSTTPIPVHIAVSNDPNVT